MLLTKKLVVFVYGDDDQKKQRWLVLENQHILLFTISGGSYTMWTLCMNLESACSSSEFL